MTAAAALLARCRAIGVDLAPGAGGALNWEADFDPPTELLADLKAHKAAILGALDVADRADPAKLPPIPTAPTADVWPCWFSTWPDRFPDHRRRWRSIHGCIRCAVCVPPAHPGLVAEWLDVAPLPKSA